MELAVMVPGTLMFQSRNGTFLFSLIGISSFLLVIRLTFTRWLN